MERLMLGTHTNIKTIACSKMLKNVHNTLEHISPSPQPSHGGRGRKLKKCVMHVPKPTIAHQEERL